jgi:hypothetical protein
VLENLTEITAVDPATTGWTSDKMLRFVLRRIANAFAEVFAPRNHLGQSCCVAGLGITVSWPLQVPHSHAALGILTLDDVRRPHAVTSVSRQYCVLPSTRISNLAPRQSSLIFPTLRLPLHRWRDRVLHLQPVGLAAAPLPERHFSAGSITRSSRSAINCCWLL